MRPRVVTVARLTLVAALAAATGCGPTHSITVGVRDYATDVLLKQATLPPAPVVAPPPVQPGFPLAPVPVSPQGSTPAPRVSLPTELPTPPPPVQSCPTASPLVGPRHPAPARATTPPAKRSYVYRETGSYRIGAPHAAAGGYPASTTRKVTTVGAVDGGYSFTVADDQGMTIGYDVYPDQRVAPTQPIASSEQPQPTQAGIYVASFTYKRADNTLQTLRPQPEVLLAPFPLDRGTTWRSKGVDPATGITVVLNGQVGRGKKFAPLHDRVDACGTVLDAYWVEYTIATDDSKSSGTGVNTAPFSPPSSLQGTDLDVNFVGTALAFGTQYGGLPLAESDVLKGTDGGASVDIRRYAVISSEPTLVTGST